MTILILNIESLHIDIYVWIRIYTTTQFESLGIYMFCYRLFHSSRKGSGLLSTELEVKGSVGKGVVVAHKLFVGGELVVFQARQALGTYLDEHTHTLGAEEDVGMGMLHMDSPSLISSNMALNANRGLTARPVIASACIE